MTITSSIPWDDVEAVGIRTTADGPFTEDVFWQFLVAGECVEVPTGAFDEDDVGAIAGRFAGFDIEKFAAAMVSTRERTFRVWHREESRFAPTHEDLAARFAALVGCLGGQMEAAEPVFARVYAAYAEAARHYHGLEHVIDCLREVDRVGAGPIVELALWYHDVVYEPGGVDCEERSAEALLADARELAIPSDVAGAAAEAVRATAHVNARSIATTPETDLVLDIDLSILGRDALRFMDYEYAVEEEYAAVPTPQFRRGRARVLAALLARPFIYRTEAFRERYEQAARAQLTALLESPRYGALTSA